MLMPSLDTSIAHAGLPALAHSFNASFQEVQWIVLAYLLTITALIVSVGKLGDSIGRRRLLLIGIGMFTLASLLCGIAPTLWWLVLARAAQGLGAAMMMTLTMALASDILPQAQLGRALGLLGTMSAIGTTLGPSVGGWLITGFGWPMIFILNVPLGIINFLMALHTLPMDQREAKSHRAEFDIAGTLMLVGTLVAYALAMTTGHGQFGSTNITLLLAALGGIGGFVLIEARVTSPLIQMAMFRDPVLSSSLTMSTLVSTVMMATLVVGPFYLTHALGLRSTLGGLALSAGPLIAALTGVPAGFLVDRFGAQRMAVIGLLGIAIGSSMLAIIPLSFGLVGYLLPITVLTANYALFQAANNTVLMTGLGQRQRGTISGLVSLSRNLGFITGTAVMGAIFAAASATTNSNPTDSAAIAIGMRTTFAVAAGLIVLALAIALFSRRLPRRLTFISTS